MSHIAAHGSRCDTRSKQQNVVSERQPHNNTFEILNTVKVGTEVGIVALAEEFDHRVAFVIYRLIDAHDERDYMGPFMIDVDGVVRVAGPLIRSDLKPYRFIIEALASDGMSSRSDILSVFLKQVKH